MEKDRNSTTSLKEDIAFIDDLQAALRNSELEAVEYSLSEWKKDLRILLAERKNGDSGRL